MSKKKVDLSNVNPFDYQYKQDEKVEVEGWFLNSLESALSDIMHEERQELYEEIVDEEGYPDIEKTYHNKEKKTYYTAKGKYFLSLYTRIMNYKADNIESGVAKLSSELQMKKVD